MLHWPGCLQIIIIIVSNGAVRAVASTGGTGSGVTTDNLSEPLMSVLELIALLNVFYNYRNT